MSEIFRAYFAAKHRGLQRGHFVGPVAVGLEMRAERADLGVDRLQRRRGLQRRVEIDALRGGEQLDRDHAGGVARDPPRLARGDRRHRDMVLLARAEVGIESTLAGKARLLFSLTKSGGGDLRDHEARIDPAVVDQEGRQAAHLGIDQHRRCGAREIEPTSHRAMAMMSAAKATGWAWKLPPEMASSLVREQDRIVGHRIGLDLERARGVGEQVERGAHHLRLAAEAVGVLHPVAIVVAGVISLPSSRPRRSRGDRDLAGLAARVVDARVERRAVPLSASTDSAPACERGGEHALADEQGVERDRGRGLGAVDQRQPFLGAEHQRLAGRGARSASRGGQDCRRRGRCGLRRSAPRSYGRAGRGRPRRRRCPAPG